MAANQVGPGKAYSNERIGDQGGAKAHTPRQSARQAKNKHYAEMNKSQAPSPAGLPPLNSNNPARMLGRQFNEAVHRRVGGSEGMHSLIDNLANTYHNVQVYQSPGAYGYIHAIRQGLGPRPSDMIGAPKQEELALQRRWASQAGQGNVFL